MGLNLTALLDVRFYQAFDVGPDGRVLAGGDDSGSTQLMEIAADGSVTPLTALPGPCSGRYGPGWRSVLVSHDDGGNERAQLSVLRLPRPDGRPAGLADLEPLVHDPRYMHTLADVRDGRLCYFTNRRNDVDFDPVIRDLTDGSERALQVGNHRFGEAALSPDGRWLALTVSSPGTANAEHVTLVDLSSPAGHEQLTAITPPDAPALNYGLCFTPGSDALYFTSNNDREFTAVARYELADGRLGWVVTDDRFDLSGWLSPDGATLLVERNNNGASELARHDAASGARLFDVPLPSSGCLAQAVRPVIWAADSAAVALTFSSAELPSDVLLVPAAGQPAPASPSAASEPPIAGGPRLLTHSAAALRGERAARPEQHHVPGDDGQRIPCLVYRPDSGNPAGGSPGTGSTGTGSTVAESAVLVVHGGPEGQSRQGFSVYTQLLAAAGHTVLVPNVRGSAGYGKSWYSADDGRQRMNSVDDLAALHAYLPRLGLDPQRAALWGGSYGGYMVLAGLAFQSGLWAAGVDIVGIASLVTFLENTSAYRRAYREREYGTLARDRDFLHSVSPLSRIDDIVAPLFIIHGANDPRVPLSEAEQIHAALSRRGRECELLVYGDEGHGLARRANRLDAFPRACAFLARHLAAAPAAHR